MYVLCAMPDAEAYRNALATAFPGLSVQAATTQEEMRPHMDRVEILVTIFRVEDDLLKQAAKLKWIQVTTSGVNYLLGRPSLGKDVIVTSARGIHGPQVSEMAFLLMLALNRNFPENVRNQDRHVWKRWPGRLLHGKTIAILGIGVIGEEIARKSKAFGMTVYGLDIVKRDAGCVDQFLGPEELHRIAPEVDYLVLVAPSTPDTQKLVNADLLSRMKPTAFVINVARGELVDDDALIDALKSGRIAGAALDALSMEPLPKEHPLWAMDRVIITPHIAGDSDTYREQVLPIIEENLRRFLRGERRDLINYVGR